MLTIFIICQIAVFVIKIIDFPGDDTLLQKIDLGIKTVIVIIDLMMSFLFLKIVK